MSSNEPVKNGCEVIFEMFHILISKSAVQYMEHFIYYFTRYLCRPVLNVACGT